MSESSTTGGLTKVQWLICAIAALGFAFDIYELLVFPLISRPALAELLKALPADGPPVINVHGHLHERGGESCTAFPAGPSWNAASVTLTKNPRAPNLLMVVVTPDGRLAAKYF